MTVKQHRALRRDDDAPRLVSRSFNRDDFQKSLDRFYVAIENAARTLHLCSAGELEMIMTSRLEPHPLDCSNVRRAAVVPGSLKISYRSA